MVRGIGPSADPMLQARIFAYPDAARYRLGVNHNQLPVNAPLNPVANFQRDGFMAIHNQGARPNYASSIAPLRYLRAEKTAREAAHEVYWLLYNSPISLLYLPSIFGRRAPQYTVLRLLPRRPLFAPTLPFTHLSRLLSD